LVEKEETRYILEISKSKKLIVYDMGNNTLFLNFYSRWIASKNEEDWKKEYGRGIKKKDLIDLLRRIEQNERSVGENVIKIQNTVQFTKISRYAKLDGKGKQRLPKLTEGIGEIE
jgi:uncharacterized protein YlxW (UPF0749 family)